MANLIAKKNQAKLAEQIYKQTHFSKLEVENLLTIFRKLVPTQKVPVKMDRTIFRTVLHNTFQVGNELLQLLKKWVVEIILDPRPRVGPDLFTHGIQSGQAINFPPNIFIYIYIFRYFSSYGQRIIFNFCDESDILILKSQSLANKLNG